MRKLVLATGNQGKVAELQTMLEPFGWQVTPQSAWQLEDAVEDGTTFIENAIIKARHAAKATGLPALADDSGLAIRALNGEPGIYSARYAGANATDSSNVEKVLAAMATTPSAERQATFHCVLAYLAHANDPTPIICHGQWHGEITTQPAGAGGFGYDPIFYVSEAGCTAAELPAATKQRLSHRGQALRLLTEQLQQAN